MARVTEAKKEQVRLWIAEWALWFKLDRFHIDIKFHNKPDPSAVERETVFADVGHHYAGLEADVNIWLPFWKLTDYQKERVCAHELVHILLPDATEDEVCTITEIMWCLVKGEVNAPDR